MAVRRVSSSNAQYTTGLGAGVNSSAAARPWVRNKSWLTFTAPTASEQKFIGLHAVWPEANLLALSAAGNYTVDWGDGVVENFSSGVTAQHEYAFADTDLANTNAPVTLQGTADTVTRSSHGYVNGDVVSLYNIVTTTGITPATPYYVINATTNTFKVSLTEGGSAVDLVGDGSATLLPYKQAIVQVYPQVGQNLTSLNLNTRAVGSVAYQSGFLDIAVSSANLTDLRIGAAFPDYVTLSQNVGFRLLEQVNIVRSNCRQLLGLFFSCESLQSVLNLNTSESPAASIPVTFTDSTDTVTATGHGFNNGDPVSFTSITGTTGIAINTPYFVIGATANTFQVSSTWSGAALALTNDGSGVAVRSTTMRNIFSTCRNLRSVPLFNTSSVTDMQGMFTNCNSLQAVPLFNTAAVTNMQSMFQNCTNLQYVPLFNTASVTNIQAMFSGCSILTSVPLFNTAAVTSMQNMFVSCSNLVSVPLFNTAAVTNMVSMFNNCTSLQAVPLFNTAAVTSMSFMLGGCSRLTTVPLFNTAAVTNMQSMFFNCSSLQSLPALNTTAVSSGNFTSMFQACSNLSRIQAKDFKFTFSVASCKLSATALNEIYTNLPTVSGQTITVTGNYGTATDNPAIATAKGWTVTG